MPKHRFPRGHAQTKELIKECAMSGVAIDGLDDAPSFRFIPVDSDTGRLNSNAPPSGRGTLSVGKDRYGCKNWKPQPLDLNPQYNVPMTGNSDELNEARRSWSRGAPDALRKLLAEGVTL